MWKKKMRSNHPLIITLFINKEMKLSWIECSMGKMNDEDQMNLCEMCYDVEGSALDWG